jgi:serine/threonine-protein kinase SRPK3
MNVNGSDIKKAAINKAKQLAHDVTSGATTSNGNKKRRKGGSDLKPIITAAEGKSQDGSPASSVNSAKYS